MSDFGALRIALSSLYASQKGLEITGHNIANAKSEGYSRQTVVTTADGGPTLAAMFARWQQGGYGVKNVEVQRVNDVFLTNRTYIEHGVNGAAQTTKGIFNQLENVFPEPGANGLQQQLTDFWSAWDDVANQPQDAGARSQLVAQTNVLLDRMHQSAADMFTIRDNSTQQLASAVTQVNSLTDQIASLNATIVASSSAGRSPNDLLDQRDTLVKKLSDLVDITIRNDADGQMDIFVPGGPILMGSTPTPLAMIATQTGAAVRFANGSGGDQVFRGGTVSGLLSGINDVIPTFLTSLDNLANSLRDTVNEGLGAVAGGVSGTVPANAQNLAAYPTLDVQLRVNGGAWTTVSIPGADYSGAGGADALQTALQTALDTAGVSLTAQVTGGAGSAMQIALTSIDDSDSVEIAPAGAVGTEQAGVAQLFPNVGLGLQRAGGLPFFVGSGAFELGINSAIAADPSRLAVGRGGSGLNDGGLALVLAESGNRVDGPDARYRALLGSLGAASQRASRIADNQDVMTTQVDAAKDAESGVNVDEEMVAMVQYQHAYAAAAKFLNSVNDMLDTLLNIIR